MSGSYRRDYQELELPETADWTAARASYRQLVNRWHPDRYSQRPLEKAGAQARFIRLTRSFDRLRQYYRENERLPFESIVVDQPDALGARRRAEAVEAAEAARIKAPAVPDTGMVDAAGLFGSSRPRDVPRSRRLLLVTLAVALVLGTVAAVALIDRNERQQSYQAGRDALREAEPSDFMPSATEVHRQQTRGAFVERTDGKLGDQLMEDVFR